MAKAASNQNHMRVTADQSGRLSVLGVVLFVAGGHGQERPSGPAPGKFFDVGGHRLHLHCAGSSNNRTPTVVLEAGGGAFSQDWVSVQNLLPSGIRACAYDRAGSGWSEAGPAPRTMSQEAFELHALLQAARLRGPFVFVGQSLGAMLVRIYAEQYGNDVAGVVLVDPADENTAVFNLNAKRWLTFREQATGRPVPAPRKIGPPSAQYKPEDDYTAEEAQLLYLHRKNDPTPLGDRPLFVLAAGRRPPPPGMTEGSYRDMRLTRDQQVEELARLSRNSRFFRDPNAGHNIQVDDPGMVAKAIESVVGAVRRHARPAP